MEDKNTSEQRKSKPRGSYRPPMDRFLEKVDKTDGCWLWKGKLDKDGYGRFSPCHISTKAHRYSYMVHKGEIPTGYTIDHLCRVRKCVNPLHLEAVTIAENILRGEGTAAKNSRKTHCIHGHLLDGENLYVQEKTGKRFCRECDRKRGREYESRKR